MLNQEHLASAGSCLCGIERSHESIKKKKKKRKVLVFQPNPSSFTSCYQGLSFFRANNRGMLLPSNCYWLIYIPSQRTGTRFTKYMGKLTTKGFPTLHKCQATEPATRWVSFQKDPSGDLVTVRLLRKRKCQHRGSGREKEMGAVARQRYTCCQEHGQITSSFHLGISEERTGSGNVLFQSPVQQHFKIYVWHNKPLFYLRVDIFIYSRCKVCSLNFMRHRPHAPEHQNNCAWSFVVLF